MFACLFVLVWGAGGGGNGLMYECECPFVCLCVCIIYPMTPYVLTTLVSKVGWAYYFCLFVCVYMLGEE